MGWVIRIITIIIPGIAVIISYIGFIIGVIKKVIAILIYDDVSDSSCNYISDVVIN